MRRFPRTLALLAAAIAVGFIVVEILVRLFLPQQLHVSRPDVWSPADVFGYRHPARADTRINEGGGKVHFVTDDNGYRINTLAEGACEPEARILMLGDSFLEGLKVEEDRTIPVYARQFLEAHHGFCARIDNSGVSSWTPNHYYLEARRALRRSRYDIGVVFVYVGNDVIESEVDSFPPRPPNPRRSLRLPDSLDRGELADAFVKPVNDFLRTRSQSYMLFKTRLRQRVRRARQGRYFPEIYLASTADSPRWKVTASVCAKIQSEFERHETPVFFVLIPVFYQVDVGYFDDYVARCGFAPDTVDVDQPNRLLAREFVARGLEVLDPLDLMRRNRRQGVDMYSGWDPHFTEEGNLFMAEYISPAIISYLAGERQTTGAE